MTNKIISLMTLQILLYIASSSNAMSADEVKAPFCFDSIQIYSDKGWDLIQKDVPFLESYLNTPYQERYVYFSQRYKTNLDRAFNIKGAGDYEELLKQKNYGRTILNYKIADIKKTSNSVVSVTLLACWEQEGYSGVETYIFDLQKVDSKWKINHIAY